MPNITNDTTQSFLATTETAADNHSVAQNHSFWSQEPIDALRWNGVFPYQLLVVKSNNGKYETVPHWQFTFPFPPESISESMNPAVTGSVTQGGFIEEHGGAPIRLINFSGTLGVLPLRGAAETRKTANFAGAIFGGTVEQAKRVAVSAQGLASDFTGQNTAFQENLVPDAAVAGGDVTVGKTSGYYQMRLLKRFFENYYNFKTKKENKDARLALCLWKQQAVYLVSLTGFNSNQTAASPLEYTYNLSFRAWRRINLNEGPSAANVYVPAPRAPNGLGKILKGISDARDVLENARDILSAVVGDVERAIFTPLRQTSLFAKDLTGTKLAFTDLPKHVLDSSKAAIVGFIAIREKNGEKNGFPSQVHNDIAHGIAKAAAASSRDMRAPSHREQREQDDDSAFDVFRHPELFYDFLKEMKPGDMQMPPEAIAGIIKERNAVSAFTRKDFERMRDDAKRATADFADSVGVGNDLYNLTFQRPRVSANKTATADDYKVLFALNKFISQLNKLSATTETQRKRLSSVDYVAGLARQSGIAFREPKSKFLVPFPYGVTMEQLATRYLGDPDRWIEIAALNGLRAPYVDEEGFQVPLLTSGSGNEVVVADVTNLYLGQQVVLVATGTSKSTRRITQIISESDTLHTLVLDGDSDLARFTVARQAIVWAFLPDTVNSQMTLYIPSPEEPASADYQAKAIPGLNVYDQFLNIGGVDLLLTADNDLALTPDGDCRLAVGLQNLIQEIRIRLSLAKGSLNRHPEIGFPVSVGTSIADMSAKDIAKTLKSMFADDPVFTGVQAVSVETVGNSTKISMSVTVRGGTQPIPLVLDVRK